MTPQDTMRLALEALENSSEIVFMDKDKAHLREASIEALKAALSQQGEQKPVAEWKLAPLNPTSNMVEAGEIAAYESYKVDREHKERFGEAPNISSTPSRVWRAMIAAAPAAQPELPQKARPDFIEGYDAGMADALRRINTQELK